MGSKVYEASTLKAATRERAKQYVKLKGQFKTLKKEFEKIVGNTEFRGHGAEAIKGFYQGQIDVVDAWILFIDMNVEFFNKIPEDMADVDLSEDTVVQVPFLEDSVEPAGRMAKEIVTDQQDALQRIFKGIADLVPLTVFSKDAFDSNMDQAEKKRVQTVDKVNELDNRLSQEYASSQTQEQYIFALYSQLMEATRKGEDISPLYFDAEAYQTSKAYQVHAESIGITTTSVKQGENGKAPQIEIKNNELQNSGDVAVVKTVEVFDEIEGKTNGTYYLYENGQIIWKHPTQTGKVVYKEVDEVPESRVGGVEELDSAFDGTGLAFLGWLHPKDVLKKSVKLVIKRGGKTTVKKLSKKEIKEVSAKRFVYDKKTGMWVDKNGKPLGNVKNNQLSPSNYPNPDPPMSLPPVKYKPETIDEVIRMRQGKGPTTKMTHGDKNIEAHHRRQVPVKNGGKLDELEQSTHRGGGNHTRHDKPSQLTPSQRAKEIREHYKKRGNEYIIPGEGI